MKIFKTLFLITVISLITITVNATTIVDTTSTSISTIIKTDSITSLIFTKVYNTEDLKAPTEHIYGIMIKQQVINAWSGLIFIIVMLVLLFLSIRYLKACNNDPDINDLTIPVTLLMITSITTFVVLIITGPDILTGFLNPEYGAIKDIINFIK